MATIPPRATIGQRMIAQANAVILTRVPANRVIAFGSLPTTDMDGSGIHFTEDGKHHCAALALRVLFPQS